MARIGLIVNPRAGRGLEANAEVVRRALSHLRPQETLLGTGEMGLDFVQDLPLKIRSYDVGPRRGKERTLYLVERFCAEKVDFLLVVGGDGTLADVALVLVRTGRDVPILGLGVGSTNVGGLVTCCGREVDRLSGAEFREEKISGILASCNGELLGVGFNDCVLGYTVVATVEGRLVDVDVAEKIEGRDVPATPRPICTERTMVRKRAAEGETVIARGEEVATVVVALAEKRFFGKAISGGVCLTTLADLPAGCLVCDTPLVRILVHKGNLAQLEPFSSKYVSLDEGEEIVVDRAQKGAALCADGNPLRILEEKDRVEVRVKRQAVTCLQLKS